MRQLAILTATYNHPDELKELYISITKQTDKNLLWCIVDDGSSEETEKIVKSFIEEKLIFINYYRQENLGKSRAISLGLDKLKNTEFVLFIDDDEYLFPNAVEIVKQYVMKYKNSECAVIHFNRTDENGNVIAEPYIETDQMMNSQERRKRGIYQDGYTGYFSGKIKETRSPSFNGEKYVGPSVLFMTVCKEYKMLWAYPALGKTTYLEGGITKQGRKLRIKNPKGMYVYCLLMQHKDSGFWLRNVYSILGYAYLYYAGINESQLRNEIPNYGEKLIFYTKPLGKLLSFYWKIKYGELK